MGTLEEQQHAVTTRYATGYAMTLVISPLRLWHLRGDLVFSADTARSATSYLGLQPIIEVAFCRRYERPPLAARPHAHQNLLQPGDDAP